MSKIIHFIFRLLFSMQFMLSMPILIHREIGRCAKKNSKWNRTQFNGDLGGAEGIGRGATKGYWLATTGIAAWVGYRQPFTHTLLQPQVYAFNLKVMINFLRIQQDLTKSSFLKVLLLRFNKELNSLLLQINLVRPLTTRSLQ